ncbi:MAG: PilZ domain-containing protein, partial [Planctomycetota bacterium]
TVKSAMSVKITFGEMWRVRYYFGASTWEFDTTIVSCDGDILVLNHSDTVRFINRRRFLRVPVNKPALVALFPFTRSLYEGNDGASWRPPEFVPAVVTELAGPGLRINVALDVKVGNRVLVVVRLDGENGQNSVPDRQNSKSQTSRIVEDIGEVRHTRVEQNALSIAVELTGLSDSDLNELIRATNLASLRAGPDGQYTPPSTSEKQDVAEPAPVQGA